MKQNEFDPLAEGRYRDMMLEQYQECRNQRPKTKAEKKAQKAGQAPRKMKPSTQQREMEPSVRKEKQAKKDCKPKQGPTATTTPA